MIMDIIALTHADKKSGFLGEDVKVVTQIFAVIFVIATESIYEVISGVCELWVGVFI